jgi:hypothetical protein
VVVGALRPVGAVVPVSLRLGTVEASLRERASKRTRAVGGPSPWRPGRF